MLELLINNFEKIIGTILSSALVGYIGYRTYQKTRFNQAAATFHTKVLTELEGLYPIPTKWPTEKMMIDRILKEKFTKLQIAVAEFREFLPRSQQADFDKAWFIYRLGKDGREIDKQCYYDYMPFISTSIVDGVQVTVDTTETHKETFKHNVDSLLSFAKSA